MLTTTTANCSGLHLLSAQRQRREIAAWAKDGSQENELVHVWRVGKDAAWVELVIEGPPGSFFEGAWPCV